MAVSASFHRNVFLLNQLVPPNNDFKKLFREGMFNKPNVAGFTHVSHYLLTIYDAERYKKLVEWPVICKKDEAKFRNDVKNYLNTLSLENPDIGFPNILATYLHHAGGTKFTIIMWKLSQLTLKKYIMLKGNQGIIFAPKLGPTSDLTKTYLQQANINNVSKALNRHENCLQMEKITNSALIEEKEESAKIKTELFDKKQSVIKYINEARVNSSIRQRLTNIEDPDIIQMWTDSLNENLYYIQKKLTLLKDLKRLCENINGIISNMSNESAALDIKQFEEINCSLISELSFPPDVQHCLYLLYSDSKLVYCNFIRLFAFILCQVYQLLRKGDLADLSQCLLQIKASTEDIECVSNVFKTLLKNMINSTEEIQSILYEKSTDYAPRNDVLPLVKSVLLMPSPLIKFNTQYADDKNDLYKLLQFTPGEVTYKSLFSRYVRHKKNYVSHLKTDLFVSRINIDDTIQIDNNEKHTLSMRFATPKVNAKNKKKIGKYSCLFSACMKKTVKANYNISLPSSIQAHSSIIVNAIEETPELSNFNLDASMRNSFNMSRESPGQFTPIKRSISKDKSEGTRDISKFKVNKLELDELTEIQFINNEKRDIVVKHVTTENVSKRRSISDLVERYKKLVNDSKCATTELQNEHIEHEIERLE